MTWLVAAAASAVAGCGREDVARTELWGHEAGPAPVVRVLPLEAADSGASALHVTGDGVLWLGAAGRVTMLDAATGAVRRRAELGEPGAPSFLGFAAERLYVQGGGLLRTLDTAGVVRARWEVGAGVVALDPLGRYAVLATDNGAVVGLHPRLLRPDWAWARLGPPATAVGVSPEGDRLYLALAAGAGEQAMLLVRDVQTGRVLLRVAQPGVPYALRISPTGDLFAVIGEADPVLVALRPRRGGLHELWRRELNDRVDGRSVRLRTDDDGTRLLAFVPETGSARLFDAATGEPLGEPFFAPRDAVFAAEDGLWLLYPGELRVMR